MTSSDIAAARWDDHLCAPPSMPMAVKLLLSQQLLHTISFTSCHYGASCWHCGTPCHCTPTHEKKLPLVSTHTATACCPCYRFMYDTFVKHPGPRRCAGAFCTFTDSTKKAVGEKRFNQFCSNGVLNFMMINSPGGPRKADDSDHPLKEVGEEQKPNSSNMTRCGVLGWITALPLVWIGFLCCLALLSYQLDNSVRDMQLVGAAVCCVMRAPA